MLYATWYSLFDFYKSLDFFFLEINKFFLDVY